MTATAPPATAPAPPPAPVAAVAPRLHAAVAGTAGAAVAFGATELLAGVVHAVPSLLVAVGDAVIRIAPRALEQWAIGALGTADKPALQIGTVLVGLLAGAALGIAARRSAWTAPAGFAAFALVGLGAAAASAENLLGALAAAALATTSGVTVVRWLLRRTAPAGAGAREEPVEEARADPPLRAPTDAARGSRRDVLRLSGAVVAAAAVAGGVGRRLVTGAATAAQRSSVVMPQADAALPPPPAGAELDVPGLTPLFTPNHDFYRIDTALIVPRVDLATWRLEVTGMVDRPLSLSFDDLLGMELVEADVTLACVSNEVGGGLVGNARWTGVRLDDLLARARVSAGAEQVVGRSVDGWTGGFPLEIARDRRDALVAVAMNGEALPVAHGFPARLVVPGLYGYVSATKWLSGIELTTWDGFDGYWVPRGWSKEGPVKTSSRIDVPRRGDTPSAGRVRAAGVAWAQHRGVRRVEVRVDDGPWQEAELAADLGVDAWRQWVVDLDLGPGRYLLTVRATDGDGEVQTPEVAEPAPSGATGHHQRFITVV